MALNFSSPDPITAARLLKSFPKQKDGFIRTQPGNLLMPCLFKKHWQSYFDFQLRSDDTFVLSFPKSGTTWTQEMVWLVANNCDYQGAKVLLRERVPFLEDRSLLTEESLNTFLEMANTKNEDGLPVTEVIIEPDFIDALPSPRYIKSHLPFNCLPPTLVGDCKIVYVARNPKDVAVSWYYHHLMDPIIETTLTLEEFAEHFICDEVLYAPYWTNLIEAWEKRHHPNFLFLFYEDMKMDLPGQIEKVASFLNKKLSSEQIAELTNHLGFDNFKKNPSVNAQELKTVYFKKDHDFIRKGQIGDWKNHFSAELNSRFDKWIEENIRNTDLKFPSFSSA